MSATIATILISANQNSSSPKAVTVGMLSEPLREPVFPPASTPRDELRQAIHRRRVGPTAPRAAGFDSQAFLRREVWPRRGRGTSVET